MAALDPLPGSLPGHSSRWVAQGTVKTTFLVCLGQVPLSLAKRQDQPNIEGPRGLGWDSYFPQGESQAGRSSGEAVGNPKVAQLSSVAFFLLMMSQ